MIRRQQVASTVLFEGRHLRFMRRGSWEYADRRGVTGVVGIVAVTDEGKLLLVEQFRAPVNARVIELPAGLVGDEPGHEAESLLAAANRELNEETGYNAANMVLLTSGPSSAGMSNEIVTLCYATKLTRRNSGGGVGEEDIVVHEVPLAEITRRLRQWTHDGKRVDLKVYAAQHFAAIIGFQGS